MPKRNQYIVPHPQGWAVKKQGSKRITALFDTQEEAIEYGRDLAITQRCELVIHDRKGEVRKQLNYNHPRHAALRYERLRAFYAAQSASSQPSPHSLDNAANN